MWDISLSIQGATMFVKRAGQREWKPAGYEGAERVLLRETKEQGPTYIVRLKAGARGFTHRHAAGEDFLVLSGKVRLAGEILGPGDYLYTEAGEEHFVEAIEDSVVYASTSKPVVILEQSTATAEKV
jgi:quercetin dioxygenase-like cupin family protein